jgi:hypothetical protein
MPYTTKRIRKAARTAIYRALYGSQTSQQSNLPWADESRRRPQDWSATQALATVEHHWHDASFDPYRKRLIALDLQVTSIAGDRSIFAAPETLT